MTEEQNVLTNIFLMIVHNHISVFQGFFSTLHQETTSITFHSIHLDNALFPLLLFPFLFDIL